MTASFAPELLRVATPVSWLERASASPEVLLIDHANCEKKAASTALALMFAYAEDLELTAKMSRVAREELRHYEQVAKLIRSLAIAPRRLAPGRYAEGLRRLVAKTEPQREIDLMICGAFIEARSCERFARLTEDRDTPLAAPVRGLFASLHAAEARHYRLYLELARRAAGRPTSSEPQPGESKSAHAAVLPIEARIEEFAALEASLITRPDALFRFHSGVPDDVVGPPGEVGARDGAGATI
jgi:tRNA-(ms[2]io[6]A)-hydroxylase